jgi:hypothetical protein
VSNSRFRRPGLHFPPFAVGFAPQIPVRGPSIGHRSASCLHGFLATGQIIFHAPQEFLFRPICFVLDSRVSASQCPADFLLQDFLPFAQECASQISMQTFPRWRRDLSTLSRLFISFWPGASARRCCLYSFRDFC